MIGGWVIDTTFLNLIHLPLDFASKDHKLTWLCFSITHRVTKAGGAFDEAMRKLQSLKLAEHIEQSGANLLSDAISAYLVKMEAGKARLYKNALVGRNSALEDSRPYYH